jgi:hypothetical protein
LEIREIAVKARAGRLTWLPPPRDSSATRGRKSMSNIKIASVSVLAVALVAGAAATAVWKPPLPDIAPVTWSGKDTAVERAALVQPAPRPTGKPLSKISDVFQDIDPKQYDQSIAQSKLSVEDAKVLKSLLPEGKVKLAGLVMSGQGQTVSITGVGLTQTVKLEPMPQTLTIPYIPGVPVTFQRDKADEAPGAVRIHANQTAVISMQALIPGSEVKMSTPKDAAPKP